MPQYDPYRLTPFTWSDRPSSTPATTPSSSSENSLPNYLGMQSHPSATGK